MTRKNKVEAIKLERMHNKHFGGNREVAIQRDGEKCVQCGMTREEHREKFGIDITVDHINGVGKFDSKSETPNHSLSNLQTLCKTCHTRKDNTKRVAVKGSDVNTARLKDEDILIILDRLNKNHLGVDIARDYKVDKRTISAIKMGITWKHILREGL